MLGLFGNNKSRSEQLQDLKLNQVLHDGLVQTMCEFTNRLDNPLDNGFCTDHMQTYQVIKDDMILLGIKRQEVGNYVFIMDKWGYLNLEKMDETAHDNLIQAMRCFTNKLDRYDDNEWESDHWVKYQMIKDAMILQGIDRQEVGNYVFIIDKWGYLNLEKMDETVD
jgi:hypothetical protein